MAAHISKELARQRQEILDNFIGRGITGIRPLVLKVKHLPEFSGCSSYTACYTYIKRFFKKREEGKDLSVEKDSPPNHVRAVPQTQQPKPTFSRFDEIINRVSAKIPPSVMGEVDKFFRALRPEWNKLEAAARRAAELEQKVSEYEKHVCPDADARLREQNDELRREVKRLALRVEALSHLTEARICSEHLVVHSH